MKKLIALLLAVAVLSPAVAFAGGSTDAALGLGAFAVFNQILGGVGIFQGLYPQPAVVVAPPPRPVIVAPPAPAVVVAPPPPPVLVREYHYPVPAYYAYPVPAYYAYPAPAYYRAPRKVVVVERSGFCPPGHARKGWCYGRY